MPSTSQTDFNVSENRTVFTEEGILGTTVWSVDYNGTSGTATAPNDIVFAWDPPFEGEHFTVPSISNSTGGCTTTQYPSPSSGYASAESTTRINFSYSTICTTEIVFGGVPSGYVVSAQYADSKPIFLSPSEAVFRTPRVTPSLSYSVSIKPPADDNASCVASYSFSPSSGMAVPGSTIRMDATASGYIDPQTDEPC